MKTVKRISIRLAKAWHHMVPADRKVFTKLVGKSVNSFRHVAEGRRGISSDLAIRIEKASEKMADRMPTFNRMELNETCRKCEYARRCAGRNAKERPLW